MKNIPAPFLLMAVLVISGCNGPTIPTIPTTGWTRNGNSWHQNSWQVADMNGDGRVDYLRVQEPAGSFNHRIWIDQDHDGYFDIYSDAHGNTEKKIHIAVPDLGSKNERLQLLPQPSPSMKPGG